MNTDLQQIKAFIDELIVLREKYPDVNLIVSANSNFIECGYEIRRIDNLGIRTLECASNRISHDS